MQSTYYADGTGITRTNCLRLGNSAFYPSPHTYSNNNVASYRSLDSTLWLLIFFCWYSFPSFKDFYNYINDIFSCDNYCIPLYNYVGSRRILIKSTQLHEITAYDFNVYIPSCIHFLLQSSHWHKFLHPFHCYISCVAHFTANIWWPKRNVA